MKKLILLLFAFANNINFTNAQWQQTNGPYNISCLAVGGTNIFAGNTPGGVFLSTNNGVSWTPVNNGLSNTNVNSLFVTGTNVFASTEDGVFLSSNNGTNWTASTNGLPANPSITSFAVSGTKIFAGSEGYGVFISTDTGGSWTAVNNGLTDTNVLALVIVGTNIFAGTANSSVFLSTNNGTSWTNTGSPRGISSFGVNGTNIFAVDGLAYDSVFLSTNNGVSWTEVNNGLPAYFGVSNFAMSGTNIFAGSRGWGVFLSTNTGASWTAVNNGLTFGEVGTIAISGIDIFAGTNGGGIWKRPLSDMIQCGSNFSISADTALLHHYIITNDAFGVPPLKYDWSWGDGSHDTIPYPSHTYADSGFYNICLSITDSTGCQSTFCDSSFHVMRTTMRTTNYMVYIDVVPPTVTGISTINSQTSQIAIYPNPATNQLTIHTSSFYNEAVIVSVMNVLGQIMQEEKIKWSNDISMNIKNLPAGIYFLQMKSESGRVVRKFVKE